MVSAALRAFWELRFFGAAFGVVCGSEKHNDGGEVHPHQKADGCSDAAVHYVIRHVADVRSKNIIHGPPEKRRENSARQNVALAAVSGAAHAIHDHENRHAEHEYSHDISGLERDAYGE